MQAINIPIGAQFGWLTVTGDCTSLTRSGRNRRFYPCKCKCGTIIDVDTSNLRRGHTQSCGCYQQSVMQKRSTHGQSRTRLYHIWFDMKRRCTDAKNIGFKDYGAKGISVCPEWSVGFADFYAWAIANGYTDALTIDRIDPNGNYEPSNCRWISGVAQMRNKRNTVRYSAFGEAKTIGEWAEDARCVVKQRTLYARLSVSKWPVEKAITTPA